MALWTPANYGTGSSILVDIDPDTFTGISDGDPIDTGQDASGNGRHMTAAGTARPTWQTNEINGHAVARFDGTDDVASIADTGLTGQPFVLAAVTRFAAPVVADASLVAGSGWGVRYEVVGSDVAIEFNLGTPLRVDPWYGGIVTTTPLILVGGYDGDTSLYRVTSEQQLVRQSFGTTGYPDAFTIGADAAGTGDFAAMDLARLIVANYVSEDDVGYLLGYLAWEYGLEATLPPDSPYLLAAPEVIHEATPAVFAPISSTDFAALAAPADDQLGQAVAVATAAGSSDFVAIARTNAAGVNEWYAEGDSFQVGVSNLVSVDNDGGSPLFNGATGESVDLTEYNEVMFAANVDTAGSGVDLVLRYRTGLVTYVDLTTETIDCGTNGAKYTGWEPIPSGAKLPVFVIVDQQNMTSGDIGMVAMAVVAHFRR